MPQASEKQRQLMTRWFGSIGDGGPEAFLLSHGYTCLKWRWYKPTRYHVPTCAEMECISFLINEWDYGELVDWKGELHCTCGMQIDEGDYCDV